MKLRDGMKVIATIDAERKIGSIRLLNDGDIYFFPDRGNKHYLGCRWNSDRIIEEYDIRIMDEDILHLREGDVFEDSCGEKRKVLGVCGEMFFYSYPDEYDISFSSRTFKEAKEDGWKLIDPKPETFDDDTVEVKVEGKIKRISRMSAKELGLI